MDILLPLLPASWRPYAKSILAAIGLLLTITVAVIPVVPSWVTIAVSALTMLGVYAQPNTEASAPEHLA